MSFTDDIIIKYAPTLAGRMWWDEIPPKLALTLAEPTAAVAPFCIVEQLGGVERVYVDNEPCAFSNARVQFTMWGRQRRDVDAALDALRLVILASGSNDWYARPEGVKMHDSNEVLKLRGSRQDFVFWYKNP